MYRIFEIKLKTSKIDLEENLDKIRRLNWHSNGPILVKDDNGIQYILDLTSLKLKCVIGELFPLEESEWLPEDWPSREELINTAIAQLRKLPFNLAIEEVWRIVEHE